MVDAQRVIVGHDRWIIRARQRVRIVGSVHAWYSLAASNCGNDLDFIPIDQDRLRMLAPGNDFSIALDGDALTFEREVANEIGNPLRG